MPRLALTLRILLAVALILNGIGGAVAGVAGMESGVAAAGLVETGSDCGAHTGESTAPDGSLDAATHPCPANGDDCSDDPRCLQACAHACMAVSQRFAIGVQVNASRPPHPFMAGHPAPPTRSPIRPPIT